MIKLFVRSNVGCEIRRDEGHLAFDVGLNAQIVLWVEPLGSLSDTNPLLSRVESDFHIVDKGSTCRGQELIKSFLRTGWGLGDRALVYHIKSVGSNSQSRVCMSSPQSVGDGT